MKRLPKAVRMLFVAIVGMALFRFGIQYVSALYHRRQAERMLAYVQTLQPGITTETEFRAAVEPLSRNVHWSRENEPGESLGVTYDYQFFNEVEWAERPSYISRAK